MDGNLEVKRGSGETSIEKILYLQGTLRTKSLKEARMAEGIIGRGNLAKELNCGQILHGGDPGVEIQVARVPKNQV